MSALEREVKHLHSFLRSAFIYFSSRISQEYKDVGTFVEPFLDSGLPHFDRLLRAQQEAALRRLKLELKILVENQKQNCGNNATSLWRAFKLLNLRAGNNFFQRLRPEHQIEIYSLDGIQIWRNINVMEVCSYTIEEIVCHEWFERYSRDRETNEKIFKIVAAIKSLSCDEFFEDCVPTHVVTEKFSEERYILSVQHDCFFPLFDEYKRVVAFAVTSLVEIIGNVNQTADARIQLAPSPFT